MSEYLVTYDLKETDPKPHREFALAAEKEGLLYVYKPGDDLRRLPNTTLWGEFANKSEAREAFGRAQDSAEKKLKIKIVLEKRVITKMLDIYVLSDRKKAPDRKWTEATDFETCRKHQLNDPYFAY